MKGFKKGEVEIKEERKGNGHNGDKEKKVV